MDGNWEQVAPPALGRSASAGGGRHRFSSSSPTDTLSFSPHQTKTSVSAKLRKALKHNNTKQEMDGQWDQVAPPPPALRHSVSASAVGGGGGRLRFHSSTHGFSSATQKQTKAVMSSMFRNPLKHHHHHHTKQDMDDNNWEQVAPTTLGRSASANAASGSRRRGSFMKPGVSLARAVSGNSVNLSGDKVYSLRDLIERNKWKKLLKFLETAEGRDQVRRSSSAPRAVMDLIDDDDDEEEEEDGFGNGYSSYDGTALHHAVFQGAPAEIVREIGNAGGPSLSLEVDSGGWTALHAAAAAAAAPCADGEHAVVYLIGLMIGGGAAARSSDAVSSKDKDGRTPLHLACMERPPARRSAASSILEHARRSENGGGSRKARKLCPAVIRALADASPEAVQVEDDSGLTPLDYAVMSFTDLDGNFSPGSKPSSRVLSEAAIAPMVRHCHALWSKRAAETSKKVNGNTGDDDAVPEHERDEKKTEETLRSERGAWTKRRSSAVRSALQVQDPDAVEEGSRTKRRSSGCSSTIQTNRQAAHNNREERRKERRRSQGRRSSFGSVSLDQSMHDFIRDLRSNKSERDLFDPHSGDDGALAGDRGGIHDASFSSVMSSGGGKAYSVRDLIERHKWKKLRKFLETPAGRKQVRSEEGSSPHASSSSMLVDHQESTYSNYDGTVLHHVVSQGAPLDIVHAVGSTVGPTMWSEVDSGGWTALHVAAASYDRHDGDDLILYLIALFRHCTSASVSARDEDGRTPLHLASMEHPPRRRSGSGGGGHDQVHKKTRKLCPTVIRALADASPEAVQIEDSSGLTPLDYAVMSVTDLDGKFRPDLGKSSSARIVSEAAIFPMIRHCHALWSKRAAEDGGEGAEAAKVRVERGAWTKRRSSAVRSAMQANADKIRMEQRRFTDSVVGDDVPGLDDETANNRRLRQPSPEALAVAE